MNKGALSEYYNLPVGARQLNDLIEHKEMNFAVGNIFKAAYRLGEKEGTSKGYDLYKIILFSIRELVKNGEDPQDIADNVIKSLSSNYGL